MTKSPSPDVDAVPADPQAERNILSYLLAFGTDAAAVLPALRPEHFVDEVNRTVFRAFVDLLGGGQACGAGDVAAALTRRGKTNESLAALTMPGETGTITAGVAAVEFDKLAAVRQKREILRLSLMLGDASRNGRDPSDILADAHGELSRIAAEADPQAASRFRTGLLSAGDLDALVVPSRRELLDRWFAEGDLGFLFAQRGVGKTWLSLLLGRALAGGEAAGPWKGNKESPAKVLYVDGEMPLELLKARQRGLGIEGDGVTFLNHEALFDRTGNLLNLSEPAAQREITSLCREEGFNVLVLDNLSCLFQGISENDADAWEMVLPWLLDLRRLKIAVLIVAHAGRNNAMRGTSRREDAAAWVIRLDDAAAGSGPKNGAKFVSSFAKPSRNTPENIPPLEWTVTTDAATGRSSVAYKEAEGEEAVLGWVRNGLNSCSEIADEMHVSRGTVSKMATRLIEAGKLKREGRNYAIPLLGDEAEGAADDE